MMQIGAHFAVKCPSKLHAISRDWLTDSRPGPIIFNRTPLSVFCRYRNCAWPELTVRRLIAHRFTLSAVEHK